jgi:precorrin-4/cobalt-precorrin-4 C11-methyltransferase
MATVWFVGAGPGDPDLITVKGRALLERAGAILYAGSLVDRAAMRYAPPGCEIRDSRDMTLEAINAWLIAAAARCDTVVRLQTGDPGLYGALTEMSRALDAAGVAWKVVPGVSSALAAAAAAGETLTLPELTQTVILTRVAGRAWRDAVHLPVDHSAARSAGGAARGRLGRGRAGAGGAQGELAG